MNKRLVLALFSLLLATEVTGAFAAGSTAFDPMRTQLEMRTNIAWTVDGLAQLGESKDRALKLNKAQARKILPIYKALIAKKIIQLKLEKVQGKRPGFPGSGPEGGSPDSKPQVQPGGDPQHQQERMRESAALVTFGNRKMEAINRILTKKQVEFIDNLDFNAEKYGFPNRDHFSNHPGGNFQSGAPSGHLGGNRPGNNQPGGDQRRSIRKQRPPMDPKLEAGRKRLIKLNQAVLKMLES
jgi:hypothetical protein